MKNKGMSIPINIIFAIFIVMFVFFVMFQASTQSAKNMIQRENFEYYNFIYDYFLSVLSNPECWTYAGFNNQYQPKQGLIEADKMMNETHRNRDILCVDNTRFLPSLIIRDRHTNQEWMLGLERSGKFPWVEREITVSFPVAVFYDDWHVNGGEAVLTAMIGEIPTFIGKIKEACITQESQSMTISNNYNVEYINKDNLILIGDDFFYPYFSCNVASFNLTKGNHISYIQFIPTTESVRVVI